MDQRVRIPSCDKFNSDRLEIIHMLSFAGGFSKCIDYMIVLRPFRSSNVADFQTLVIHVMQLHVFF